MIPLNLSLEIFKVLAPVVADIIRRRQAAGDANPTDAQILADFESNITTYLAEGADWKAQNPTA